MRAATEDLPDLFPGSVIPPVWAVGRCEQPRAEVAERVGEQPADVHLGDAELLADLGPGHAAGESAGAGSAARAGQLAPVCGEGLNAEQVVDPRVLTAEAVGSHSPRPSTISDGTTATPQLRADEPLEQLASISLASG